MNKVKLSKTNVLVITHFFATGPAQELVNYLKDKVDFLAFIEHPFSFANRQKSTMEVYREFKITQKLEAPKVTGPEIVYYLKDFFFSLYFGIKAKKKFGLCFAADNLNSLAALVLKKMGIAERVIYITVDYTPQRFENTLLNWIYHQIDKFCCQRVDLIWNSSSLMAIQREKRGISKKKSAYQLTVPDGSNFEKIKRLPLNRINRHQVIFMGHLRKNKGIEMLLEVFPEVCQKVKKASLLIIGTGELEKPLKLMAKKLGIEGKVTFTGFVEKHEDVEKMMTKAAVAVAPYVPDNSSFSFYSDVGKPKAYLACGLPVVITRVPQIAEIIDKNGAGFAIGYNPEALSIALTKLLSDDKLYNEMREKAIKLGSTFSWSQVFGKAFNQSKKHL